MDKDQQNTGSVTFFESTAHGLSASDILPSSARRRTGARRVSWGEESPPFGQSSPQSAQASRQGKRSRELSSESLTNNQRMVKSPQPKENGKTRESAETPRRHKPSILWRWAPAGRQQRKSRSADTSSSVVLTSPATRSVGGRCPRPTAGRCFPSRHRSRCLGPRPPPEWTRGSAGRGRTWPALCTFPGRSHSPGGKV